MPPKGYEGGLDGWEMLAASIWCQKGVVAVVPDIQPETTGSILLPSGVGANVKPDVGTVVSSGHDELVSGDRVVFHPWAGTWFKPFRVGCYEVPELAFFGLISPGDEDMVVMEKIEDVIPLRLAQDAIVPLGEMVLLKRDPLKTASGALWLADDSKERTLKATVVSAGPKAFGPTGERLNSGDRVIYHGASILVGLKGLGESMGGLEDLSDYTLIRARNIYAVIDENTCLQ